jgi:hypothetical protein
MRRVRHRRISYTRRGKINPKQKSKSRWTNPKKPKTTIQERRFVEGAIQGMSSPTTYNFNKLVESKLQQQDDEQEFLESE